MTEAPSPFSVHPDGTEWADHEPTGGTSRRKKGKPIKLGSTANPKPKKTDLESKTRDLLRGMGFVYGKTEQYVAYTGQRKDLFGCVDGIAVREGEVWFVQTCARSAYAPHLRKMATGESKIGNGDPVPSFSATRHLAALTLLVMILWDQPHGFGTKWEHEIRFVTMEMLEACRERTRKKL